ncbi:hypothetical protein [Streptomyces sp. NPDC048603]|uniref:hypothetical protein n=1 Tax=Streptomyces sp. NPDC048603 TaxID=3365577 RepID=UPI003723E7DA
MPKESAPMRVTRAAMFAAVCVALAAMGHSSMSGTDVPAGGLMSAFGVTAVLAWLGAGRRRGPVGITVSLLTVQGVLHTVFSAAQAGAASAASRTLTAAPAVPAPPAAGHAHHHMPETVTGATAGPGTGPAADMGAGLPMDAVSMHGMPMDGMDGMAGMVGMAGHGGLGMLAAHLTAGLFCALWLARGETAVFRLARALRVLAVSAAGPVRRVLALARAWVPAPPPRPAFARPFVRPRRLRGAVHDHAVVRRGPPRGPCTRATAPGRPAFA